MGVAPVSVPKSLALVLNSAGDKSGVDFDYLLQTAIRESSLNPEAKATGSSAVGLFQFLESTWLQTMKEQGPALGYSKYADAISRNSDGDYYIADANKRAVILGLREDPQVAADLAAAFTRANGEYLESAFGRRPSAGELYIAHFLGAQGAEKMFRAGLANPDQSAVALFPRQARANPTIFYADGHPRTVREVYKALVAQHTGASSGGTTIEVDSGFAAQQIANGAPPRWPIDAVPSRLLDSGAPFSNMFTTGATGSPLAAIDAATFTVPVAAAERPIDLVGYTTLPPVTTAALDPTYVPLPAPAPLVPPTTIADAAPAPLLEGSPASSASPLTDTGAPRARVLMTPRPPGAPASPFLLDIYE